jgi:pentapeptide MXKDX repeat protein
MKKMLSVFVALCFLSATAAITFAQDTPKKDDTKKSSKKKSGKKKEDTPKKDGGR